MGSSTPTDSVADNHDSQPLLTVEPFQDGYTVTYEGDERGRYKRAHELTDAEREHVGDTASAREPDEPVGTEDFVIIGQPRPARPKLPEWHGWPIPNRVALVADAGAGKSTILADMATWYRQRGKRVLVACAEAVDEWEELLDRYPDAKGIHLFDWERAAPIRSPATHTGLP